MAAFKELKVELILFLLLPIAFGEYFFFWSSNFSERRNIDDLFSFPKIYFSFLLTLRFLGSY